ncbi:MAG: hypothetical protein JO244_14610 [Solirubrobacterales bacterium]|nr:hypothetical protein [Solirubrobacterales bacterium]
MRNADLHAILEDFTADAATQLAAATAEGAEIPFELVEADGRSRGTPLYCYRPQTDAFIDARLGLLSALATYAPAARALAGLDRLAAYLASRGEPVPVEPRPRADAALAAFLRVVFAERSEFGFEPDRFEAAYRELERFLYEGQCLTTVIAPLLGIALPDADAELSLGDGLSLVWADALADAPPEAVRGDSGQPHVLAKLTVTQDPMQPPPLSLARTRFRRLLTALRLFERGGYALGPLAWIRIDTGPWRLVPFGVGGRPRLPVVITPEQEDELRAFCNLVEQRRPFDGEIAWALGRFEMGCERLVPFEALTDYLLALRALLEPEGPESARLPDRLAAICAPRDQREAVAVRVIQASALERHLIAGSAPPEPAANELVDELCEHLSALLCDVLCGHLEPDLIRLADELLADEPVGEPVEAA